LKARPDRRELRDILACRTDGNKRAAGAAARDLVSRAEHRRRIGQGEVSAQARP
jgi:hypothetical protein